ncbi:H-NS family nucleoid-associated regulatory protein [Paraburkholderia madseniana]|uniref:H-NS family nucleoid-associated regulatory protein n=1 Tax=Paraburkholderia madseniana TaxID=2599607 RepID=UPI003556D24A
MPIFGPAARVGFASNTYDEAPKPAPVSKAKAAGNYVRGPQPALYLDPTSGAAWSGRGRVPAWLAGAKDRSYFFIGGSADTGSFANAAR